MFKLENVVYPEKHLTCYESALITILKWMGLPDESPLMGHQAYFVLIDVNDLSISARFNDINVEWEHLHHLEIKQMEVTDVADLHQKIITQLQQNLPIILPVDLYFLPHTSYKDQIHQQHHVNIFGYRDNEYYMVCPYYQFKGWVDSDLIYASFFSPTTKERHIIFISELKWENLTPEVVCSLLRDNCDYMLGSSIPSAWAHLEPKYRGLAGLRTFVELIHSLAVEPDPKRLHKTNLLNLSRRLIGIGHSRYWFQKKIEASRDCFPSPDIADEVRTRFQETAEFWEAGGMRLAAGIYRQHPETMIRVAQHLELIYQQEAQLFNSLARVLRI